MRDEIVEVESAEAGSALNITKEPTDFVGKIGDTAVFSVEAENAASYQWKLSTNGGESWINAGTSTSYSFVLNAMRMSYQMKVIITRLLVIAIGDCNSHGYPLCGLFCMGMIPVLK